MANATAVASRARAGVFESETAAAANTASANSAAKGAGSASKNGLASPATIRLARNTAKGEAAPTASSAATTTPSLSKPRLTIGAVRATDGAMGISGRPRDPIRRGGSDKSALARTCSAAAGK